MIVDHFYHAGSSRWMIRQAVDMSMALRAISICICNGAVHGTMLHPCGDLLAKVERIPDTGLGTSLYKPVL